MLRKRRLFAFTIALALILTLITACATKSADNSQAQSSTAQKTPEEVKQQKQPVKLIIWVSAVVNQGFTDLIANWEKSHPDIKIETVQFVNDDAGNTKLDTALMSGEPIDSYITFSIPNMVKRIAGGNTENLDSYGAPDFVKENIGDKGIFKHNNGIYGIPISKEPQFITINKSAFDEAGIEVPKKWTLQEFREICKKLTTTKSGKTRYAIIGAPDTARMMLGDNYWYKSDGTSNFDHPAFKNFYQMTFEMMYKDKTLISREEELARKIQVFAQDAFMNGEAAMWLNAAWILQYMKDTQKYPHTWITTFAPLPTIDGENYNPGMKNNWICMNAKGKYKKETWEFLKYWATEGSASFSYISKVSKVPTWKKAKQEDIIKALLGENPEKLFDVEAFKRMPIFDENVKTVVDNYTAAAPEIQQILKEETDRYYLKEQVLDQMMTNLKTRADKAIKNAAK